MQNTDRHIANLHICTYHEFEQYMTIITVSNSGMLTVCNNTNVIRGNNRQTVILHWQTHIYTKVYLSTAHKNNYII